MIRRTPALRISLALALLTASILLVGSQVGLGPDRSAVLLDAREKVCESLAVQLSLATAGSDIGLVQATVKAFVERNADIRSAAIRGTDGIVFAEAGGHSTHWKEVSDSKSIPDFVKVPIFHGDKRWGAVEVSFTQHEPGTILGRLTHSVYGLAIFVALAGFIGYLIILRRSLRELDPASVIPERVKAAFDALSEGVLILDEKEHIVLANTAFAAKAKQPVSSLTGYKASELKWINAGDKGRAQDLPWTKALKDGSTQQGVPLTLSIPHKGSRVFSVNGVPIFDDKGHKRGVVVTFDDVTEIEQKNAELRATVMKLKTSEREIKRNNKVLRRLATVDPLTGCFNRRSFFEAFESLFKEAKREDLALSCIMADIDHFKSINDNYGHAVGDEVIKFIAELLQSRSRDDDIVGRYGGEEFCLLLPGLDGAQATAIAERIRQSVQQESGNRFTSGEHITASFGVACLSQGAGAPAELVNQADRALYSAKESGRNRVVCWDNGEMEAAGKTTRLPKQLAQDANTEFRLNAREQRERRPIDETKAKREGDANVYPLLPITKPERNSPGSLDPSGRHDSHEILSGLPNRLLFSDRIKQAIAQAQRYNQTNAVLSMRIDVLNQTDEPCTAAIKDEVFRRVGQRLGSILRCTDTVMLLGPDKSPPTLSRLGEDKFGILLTELEDAESVTWVVTRVLDSLSGLIEVTGSEVAVSPTIGVSLYPYDGDTPERLLEHADAARERVKEGAGEKQFRFYSRESNRLASEQVRIESRLRRAVENEEFVLYYQPMVDIVTDRITGFEALVRWMDPERGLVSPAEFIPIAERTGLIIPIGQWVLRTACEQAKRWTEAGFPDLRIAVNLSAAHFQQRSIRHEVRTVLDDTGLDPQRLELEITESIIMKNTDAAITTMRQLADMGVNIAIDDFGTGYSSLSYLRLFPVDSLKIDRSFLNDVLTDTRSKRLYTAMVVMARSLDLQIVAEGIETQEQLAFVRDVQCDRVQGFLFSRPVPGQETTKLLNEMNDGHPGSSVPFEKALSA